jgi:hypothetical protein
MFSNIFINYIISFALGFALVYTATEKLNRLSFFVSVLLGFLIYLLISSATGRNLEGSLPFSTYPVPPHLGLDGVDLVNHYPNNVDYIV